MVVVCLDPFECGFADVVGSGPGAGVDEFFLVGGVE